MDFHTVLREIFFSKEKQGLSKIAVNSGDLHRRVGGYPGKITVCQRAVQQCGLK